MTEKKRVNDSKLGRSSSYGQGELSPAEDLLRKKHGKLFHQRAGMLEYLSTSSLPQQLQVTPECVQSLVLPGYPAYMLGLSHF